MSNANGDEASIQSLNAELSMAYKAEEEFWKQKSRQLWLSLGDNNTGYFHAITKGRKTINKFMMIEDINGSPVYEEEQIAKVITDYYKYLFTSTSSDSSGIVD